MQLSLDIVREKASENLGLDINPWRELYKLYSILQKDLPKEIKESEDYKDIDKMVTELNQKVDQFRENLKNSRLSAHQ